MKWARYFFYFVSALSLGQLLYRGPSGHYDIFADGALRMWRGELPYGIAFPSGFFIYSPSCALFFYGLFAAFPYAVGLSLYMLFSWSLFAWGAHALLKTLRLRDGSAALFYVVISSEVIGAILNARFELFTCGVVMLCGAWLLDRRREGLAYFFLAMLCNFKMQVLPIVGLLLLLSFREKRVRPALFFLGALAFWYLAPYAVRPWGFVNSAYAQWSSFLAGFMESTWKDFQHLYRFLRMTLGWDLSFSTAKMLGLTAGIAFALALFWSARRAGTERLSILRALAWGTAFTLMFSPMSQSAAYVLYAPLLLAILQSRERGALGGPRMGLVIVGLGWFLISGLYSDFVPLSFRIFSFEHALKPLGVALLTLPLLIEAIRGGVYEVHD